MKIYRILLVLLTFAFVVGISSDSIAASIRINHAGGALDATLSSMSMDSFGNITLAVTENLTGTGGGSSDTEAPSIPSGLSASAVSSSQVDLSWTSSTDNVGVSGYKIFRGGSQIANTSSTSYSNTGLSASTGYCYNVAAYDSAGNTSNQSSQVCATTSPNTGGGSSDTEAPSIPSGLSASAVSSSQVDLSWTSSTDNVGVSGYKIFRGGSQIANTSSTSYANTGLSASTQYCYNVAAYDSAGNTSSQSSQVCAVTSASSSGGTPSTGTMLVANEQYQDSIGSRASKFYYFTLNKNMDTAVMMVMKTRDWTGNQDVYVSTQAYPVCTTDGSTGSTYSSVTSTNNETIYMFGSFRQGTVFYVTVCDRADGGSYKLYWGGY